jgi:hypothetical protein
MLSQLTYEVDVAKYIFAQHRLRSLPFQNLVLLSNSAHTDALSNFIEYNWFPPFKELWPTWKRKG